MTARHLLILLAATAALAACAPADKGEDAAKPSALVTSATVESASLADTVTAFGAAEFPPAGEITLAALGDGTVEAVLVSAGAQVTRGTELLRLKPSPQADLQLKTSAADLDLASRALDRAKRLRAAGLASDAEVETARAAQVTAEATRASLTVRASQQRSVRSPADGVVETLNVTPGDQVLAGAPLLKMGAASSLRVRLSLDAAEAARLRAGAPVTLSSLQGDGLGTGEIGSIEPRIDPQTRLASVIVRTRQRLTPGMGLRGEIALSRTRGATIPRAAVTWDDDAARVFVVEKGVAHSRTVKLGPETEGKIGVTDGLKPGERVVVEGAAVLEDGMAVREGAAKTKPEDKP